MTTINEYFKIKDSQATKGGAERYNDLLVVIGLAAIVALMIVPLPLFLIDALVAINITFACMLLLSAVYISSVIQFSVFPSLLLISTLFRLALSVATTRMILLKADAGQIIETFGNVVAGGNVVVGLVVFLIITVVQFIVIAKGAERVAEVAARFSLDGMPGKQLSIDSDLRSGVIDKNEAREKRRLLEMESKLHGSLDGAMKFVKGDAIASIIIIIINLLGGLAVGILQRGMEVGDAMSLYSILTIGDGLVAQLPALLSAMAAGLIVTRSTDDRKETHLGDAITQQFSDRPRVFLVTAGACLLMATIPGFPTATFLLLGGAAVTVGVALTPALRRFAEPLLAPLDHAMPARQATQASPPTIEFSRAAPLQPIVPLMLETEKSLLSKDQCEALKFAIEQALDDAQMEIGIHLPDVSLHLTELDENTHWRFLIYETPEAFGAVQPDEDPVEAIAGAFRRALRRHACLFLGIQETNALLSTAGASFPDVVQEIARALPVPHIAEILRRLVQERVPIRDMRIVLEALAEAAPKTQNMHEQVEAVRIGLMRHLTHKHAPDGVMRVLRLSPTLEDELQGVLQIADKDVQLALSPERAREIIDAVREAFERTGAEIIITQLLVRRPLWRLLSIELHEATVLSFNEIASTVSIDDVEMVGAGQANTKEIAAEKAIEMV